MPVVRSSENRVRTVAGCQVIGENLAAAKQGRRIMSAVTSTAPVAFEGVAPDPPESMRGSRGRHRRSLHGRIASGLLGSGGWSIVVATTGVSGLNFLFHVLISRLLGPSHYGALGAVLNVISVLGVPLGAVQLAVTRAVAPGQGKGGMSLRRLIVKAMLWGTWGMAAVWLLSPLIDGFLNLQSPSANLTIGVWIPIAVVAAVLQGVLLGELRFAPVAVATFLGGGALRLASGALLVVAGFGLEGAVAATVVGQVCTTAALVLVARREVFATGVETIRISLRDAVLSIAGACRVHDADRDRRIPGSSLSRACCCGSLRSCGDRRPYRPVPARSAGNSGLSAACLR